MINSANTQLPLFPKCSRCRETKPLHAFPRNRRRPSGYQSACKLCHSETESKRYHANRPIICAARRFRRHGVSADTYQFLLRAQDNTCADCGMSFSKCRGSPCVDHDAKTGKVRALLCNRCNLRIGMADHSMEILTRDIIYLLKYSPPDVLRKHLNTLTSIHTYMPSSSQAT
jgi:hypothetical protein